MKSLLNYIIPPLSGFFLTCLPLPLYAESDPFADESDNYTHDTGKSRYIRVQAEYIEVSLEQMTSLMDNSKLNKDDVALRKHLSGLIKTQTAKIIDTQMLVVTSGNKARTQSVQEFIYPTEYEPAELPSTVKIEKGAEEKVYKKDLATGPTPTAFETRNLGTSLEVDATISHDSKQIDVRFSPNIVYHVKNIVWSEWKGKYGESNIEMPIFYNLRMHTNFTVLNGRTCLVGAVSPKDDQGVVDPSRKILVFCKANIVNVGKSKPTQ